LWRGTDKIIDALEDFFTGNSDIFCSGLFQCNVEALAGKHLGICIEGFVYAIGVNSQAITRVQTEAVFRVAYIPGQAEGRACFLG